MKIKVRFDLENNLIVRKAHGRIFIEDVLKAIDYTYKHPDFRENMISIWDFRLCVIKFDTDDLEKIYPVLDKKREQYGKYYRIALLIVNMTEVFSTMSSFFAKSIVLEMPYKTDIFYNIDELKMSYNISKDVVI